MEIKVIPPKKKWGDISHTTVFVPENCMHCDKERAKYCQSCYQELIGKNAILQQKLKQKEKVTEELINNLKEIEKEYLDFCPDCIDLAKELLKILEV